MQAAILAFQNGLDDTGCLLFRYLFSNLHCSRPNKYYHASAALSIKMSILLYLPGLLVILFKRKGLVGTFIRLLSIAALQAFFALPFLQEDPWAYVRLAFDLGRVFLYKWTVNWRFIDEQTFLSPIWARTLMAGHISVLVAFGLFRWCKPDGSVWAVLARGFRRPLLPAGLAPVTPDCELFSLASSYVSDICIPSLDVATVLFTSNLIGIIFARSLHYQFYSWYAQQLPFLAWRTRYPWVLKCVIVICHGFTIKT